MATLDELTVNIRANAGQFDRELGRLTATTQQATGRMSAAFGSLRGSMLALVPALSAAALLSYAKSAATAAAALQDMADRTGVSAGFLSEMQTEVENAGGSIDQLAQSVVFMNNFIGEAAKGNQQAADTLRQLGTSFADLQALSPEQQFLRIVDGVSRLGTQFERTEALRAVFGRGVTNLIPILSQGADGIGRLRDESRELNHALSDEQIAALDAAGDAWNAYAHRLQNTVAGAVADALMWLHKLDEAAGGGASAALSGLTGGLSSPAGSDMDAYLAKAKAGGFVTSPTVLGRQPYGPNPKSASQASAERKQATKEIKDMTSAADDLSRGMTKVGDDAVISAKLIKDSFADGLEAALFDFKSFGSAAGSILNGLARNIARRGIIDPLSNGVSGYLFGSGQAGSQGLLSGLLPSFDVGTDRVPHDMVARIHQDEMIIPAAQANAIRSGQTSGGVTFTQVINVSPGVTDQIRAEIARAAPGIASAAQAGVFQAMEKGGRAAQIVGKRAS